jgi:hypothetical protein
MYIKGKEGAKQVKNQIMPVQNKVFTTDAEDEERSEGRGEFIVERGGVKTSSLQPIRCGLEDRLPTGGEHG